jgi:hypothetical protein
VLLVEGEFDAGIERQIFVGVVYEGEVTELVERVRGVGDKLAQEDLRMRVEGVNDELKELTDFGLKFAFRHIPLLSTKNWMRKGRG